LQNKCPAPGIVNRIPFHVVRVYATTPSRDHSTPFRVISTCAFSSDPAAPAAVIGEPDHWPSTGNTSIQAMGVERLFWLYPRRPADPFHGLRGDVRTEANARWARPCEDAFEWLGENHPSELMVLIRDGGLHPADLSFAAETAGRWLQSGDARVALVPLLDHHDPGVREGALYGLARHMTPSVAAHVGEISKRDASEAVRAVAEDTLASMR